MSKYPHVRSLAERATRFLFFTGKGGVGKTTLACATAVALADAGRRVLLVSTDPASNLGHVFGADISSSRTELPGVPGLTVTNIDPEAAAAEYRERTIGPMRGVLPDEALASVEEQLSGACTTEVAAFDRFTLLLTGEAEAAAFDHVIFDTAPTGHTLRLLSLPAAWTGFLDTNARGASCLGPLSGLDAQREQYAAAVEALGDAARTTVVLVARPEGSALGEAAKASAELRAVGLANQTLAVNGVFEASDRDDPLALAMEERGQAALKAMPAELSGLPRAMGPLRARNVLGVEALRALFAGAGEQALPAESGAVAADWPSLGELIDEIAAPGRGLVMVMGKGGVGKTAVAAAVAVELAARGLPVHLTTTDPAAHVAQTVGGEVDGLRVSRIDPRAETEAYRQHVLETKGKDLDAEARALLEEDLRSPCTEEVAVFHAFSRAVREARDGFVVMDTAPTGHTLLLLDAAGSYHREILRNFKGGGRTTTPMMRLQDAGYTKVLLATLPETTPVLEAAQLQDDLRRAQIEPFAWVVNGSLAAAGPRDPLLAARAQAEVPLIEKVRDELSSRFAVTPWLAEEPVGAERLRKLAGSLAAQAA